MGYSITKKTRKERKNIILKLLLMKKKVKTKELVSLLKVSDETIRKDLIAMEKEGIIKRKHGVIYLSLTNDEKHIEYRNIESIDLKQKIATEAMKYIPDNYDAVIAIDSGSTTWCFAKLLAEKEGLNIVTNSIPIAQTFYKSNNNVYVTGGLLRSKDGALYGQWALNSIYNIGITVSILGSSGVKDKNGICGVTFDDVDFKRALAKNSEYCIALLDSSKFNKTSLLEAVKWEEIDYIITDSGISEHERDELAEKTNIIIV